jgi:hypothetical protein
MVVNYAFGMIYAIAIAWLLPRLIARLPIR